MYTFGNKSFKHRALFESYARTVPPVSKEKQQLAIASLNNLTGIFDDEIKEKIRQNPDLLVFSSALILGNFANRNDDCVLTADLKEVAEKFEYKFVDAEHNRVDVKGFIDEIGWALYPSNELIDEDDVLGSEIPVQLVIGGYLWRVVDPELCNLVEEASNPNSENYLAASTSFELLFNSYWVCVSPDRNALNPNARFIKPGDPDWEKFDAKLKANGGSGKEGGMNVFRVLKDDILPVGAGIVRNPASGIKGIAVVTQQSEVKSEEPEVDETESNASTQEIIPLVENNINLDKDSVKENKSQLKIPMVIKSLQELEAHYADFTKLESKTAVASIQGFMEEKVKELSEKHAAELKAKEEAAASAEKAKTELEARATNLGKAVEELQAKLAEIESKQAAAANEAAFNSRMAALDETFDLEDEDRALLVEEIREVKSDEVFASWMDKKKKLMKEKTKSYKAEKAKCMKDKMAKAGVTIELDEKTLDFKEVIASVKPNADEAQIPNTPVITEDLRTKLAASFAADVTVAGLKKKE